MKFRFLKAIKTCCVKSERDFCYYQVHRHKVLILIVLWWSLERLEGNLGLFSKNWYFILKLAFIFLKCYVTKWNGCCESCKRNLVITKCYMVGKIIFEDFKNSHGKEMRIVTKIYILSFTYFHLYEAYISKVIVVFSSV